MKAVFRCDASIQIGTGHVMRCLTLADALREKGVESHFICREHIGHLLDLIEQRSYQSHCLPYTSQQQPNEGELEHNTSWLGATQHEDAKLCIELLQRLQPDWLIVDHYALDIRWEKELRPYCKKIMVIDDLADRQHDCDILLDQNLLPNYMLRYEELISKTTHKLLGPFYALLKPEFKEVRQSISIITNPTKPQILINFGGIGNFELLSKIIQVVNKISDFKYYIVTGKIGELEISKLRGLIFNQAITLVDYTSNMPFLMASSDYAIGACGSTVWERFCLGLNSALVEMATNQSPLLKYLEAEDLVDNLGDYRKLTASVLSEFFNNLDLGSEKYINRKLRMMKLVDGNGTNRVSDILIKGNDK